MNKLALKLVSFATFSVFINSTYRKNGYIFLKGLFVKLFYLLLNASFVAAAQVLVYVGAVNVLILFAIMLVNKKEDLAPIPGLALRRLLSGGVCVGLFALLPRVVVTTPWAMSA